MKLTGILAKLGNASYRYVAITTLVSLLSFARNLLFMKTLGLPELGQIAMMQTLVMLVGFAQLGLINGAYIQYSARDEAINRNIVDVISSGVLLLIPIGIAVYILLATLTNLQHIMSMPTLAFGLAAGLATIASTWLNNSLVADGLLGTSNRVNISAVLLSLMLALLSYSEGLVFALISILVQPIAIVVTVLFLRPELRPRRLHIDRATITLILRLGATPFLGGLAVLAMHQVERWTIAAELGPTALGQFYIVIMFTTFFTLIPAALLNVHFPQAKRAHANGEFDRLKQITRRHVRDLVIYFVVATVTLLAIAPQVVGYLLPGKADSTHLLYYALPGLILFSIRDSASLVLFATNKMKPLLTTGATTLALFASALLVLSISGALNLATVLVARALATLPGTGYLIHTQRKQLGNLAGAQ